MYIIYSYFSCTVSRLIFGLAYATLLLPQFVFAQGFPSGIQNPIQFNSIGAFFVALIDIVILIGIPVAAIFIIYAGFLFVTAGGNEEKLRTAKQALIWALVGTAVLLGAQVIINVVQNTIVSVTP